MKSRIRRYRGESVTVAYDIPRCIHAAVCVKRLPAVFDPARRPWILPDRADADELAETVAACPTGALQVERADGADGADRSEPELPAPENTLSVQPGGPLYARGELRVAAGAEDPPCESRLAFCRCGASGNRPLCDGAHADAGFTDAGVFGGGPPDSGGSQPGPVRFTPAPNGPLLFRGPLTVTDGEGKRRRLSKGALCRCGASGTTPFCDGSHTRSGFTTG